MFLFSQTHLRSTCMHCTSSSQPSRGDGSHTSCYAYSAQGFPSLRQHYGVTASGCSAPMSPGPKVPQTFERKLFSFRTEQPLIKLHKSFCICDFNRTSPRKGSHENVQFCRILRLSDSQAKLMRLSRVECALNKN